MASRKRSRRDDAQEDELEEFMRQADALGGEYETIRQRQENMMSRISQRRNHRLEKEDVDNGRERESRSLLSQAAELRKAKDALDMVSRKRLEQSQEEEALLREASKVQKNALMSNAEIAGTVSTEREPIKSSWTCPKAISALPEEIHSATRARWHILIEGINCPPPIKRFTDMKIPAPLIKQMALKNIARPTPIQVQGIPALFAGRDTLTFLMPMIMHALEEEMNFPLEGGDGPIGLVLCPSRELAQKNKDENQYPSIRSTLVVGGEDKIQQCSTARNQGVHCIVATPGRMNDLLNRNQLHLDVCKYLVLDEADRMLDMGFDEEVQSIINKFKRPRQTDFARRVLIEPLLINVGRAGAANLDSRVVYLLECLQKTAPPVIIFSDRKGDVDEIHEYLLVKGVAAASIHGDKSQAERNDAIRQYKECTKDVLVATDIAAKGLDFPDIQHVINFDMPSEIENYVHRIGRTGRSGKTGVATTFINKDVPESALLDLKHLLIEAKQRVPPVLQALQDPDEDIQGVGGTVGCAFCGGLGHRITECPKLDKDARRIGGSKRDTLVGGDGY
eukprot:GSChrysophyteH1.ASY1.ANO1.567.1 assembled CDS